MKRTVINNLKDLFGSGFKKKMKEANSLKELRKRLIHKKKQLAKKLDDSQSGSERKLLLKKIKVLEKQISKTDKKLG